MSNLLEREQYTIAEAAALLKVARNTLHYWLEGSKRDHKTYPPVIRQTPTGKNTVTWGEFVEAGFLCGYRRDLKVSLGELRNFITILRKRLGTAYPLATQQPWVFGQKLVLEAQQQAGLPEALWLYEPVGGQGVLPLQPTEAFLKRAVFENDIVARWRPLPDKPVFIDPELRFGKPSIKGISTQVLWEYSVDGYSTEEIASDFALTITDVRSALDYESYAQ